MIDRFAARHGLDLSVRPTEVEEEMFRLGEGAKGVRDACFEMGTRGMDELITARSHLKDSGGKVVPGEVMPLYLSAVSTHPIPCVLDFFRLGIPLIHDDLRSIAPFVDPSRTLPQTSRSSRLQPFPSGPAKGGLEARAELVVGGVEGGFVSLSEVVDRWRR